MKKNVLLINPPLYFSEGFPYSLDSSVPPLGILYLASYINKYSLNFKVSVMDPAVQGLCLNEIAAKIDEIIPFAVGISAMTPQLQGCVELAAFLKQTCAVKPHIFLGGPHISADPDFLGRFADIFDFAITGEAEKTFLDSLESLLSQKDIPRIQTGNFIEDLDSIPFPDRSLIDRSKYAKYESLIYSRGCPYECYYCSRPSISNKVRYRSVENLISEIKHVYKFCGGKIDFQDDTFTIDRKRIADLCEVVVRKGLRLKWRCNTRIDLVDEELLSLMKKAGCELIHFGIESGNERVRKEIIKKGNFSNEQIGAVFGFCKKLGIKIAAYFMIGHPQETLGELRDTKRMILDSGIALLGLSIPTPFPGSRLYEIANKRGIINEAIIDKFARKEMGEGYSGNYPVFEPEQVSRDYLFSLMQEINRKFYLNFRIFWNKLKDDITSFNKLMQDAGDFASLVIRGISSRKPYVKK